MTVVAPQQCHIVQYHKYSVYINIVNSVLVVQHTGVMHLTDELCEHDSLSSHTHTVRIHHKVSSITAFNSFRKWGHHYALVAKNMAGINTTAALASQLYKKGLKTQQECCTTMINASPKQ